VTTDVLVVGARCAGASLALWLRRHGVDACVVDRARFPRDTLSTHLFQVSGAALFEELGVLGDIEATGAPAHMEFAVSVDGVDMTHRFEPGPADPPGGYSVRRHVLDAIVLSAVERAEIPVYEGTRVTGLLREAGTVGRGAGRVCGVVAEDARGPIEFRARTVVGADGRSSTIARLVEAGAYDVRPNERFACWAYFENAAREAVPRVHSHRRGHDLCFAWPSDAGLLTVTTMPELEDAPQFFADPARAFDRRIRSCPPIADLLRDARQVGRLRHLRHYPGYFRDATGPGWVLVGDAGHFKDPVLGQGISDALRQSKQLAEALAVGRSPVERDRELHRWGAWRDRDARPMYWLAAEQGSRGTVSPLMRAVLAEVADDPVLLRRFAVGIFAHRLAPTDVFSPSLVARAARRARRQGQPTGALARQVGDIVKIEVANRVRHRWRAHAPTPWTRRGDDVDPSRTIEMATPRRADPGVMHRETGT
jgi:2-polyprenyl-6-methoxyphenol hydroxylase-like FAD-dependent oxidoreductase